MNAPDLEVTKEIKDLIKKTLRVTSSTFDDDIESITKEGMAEIQSDVGNLSFSEKTIVSLKAMSLLKVYCFYSWHDMKTNFRLDNQGDILSLQIVNAKAKRSGVFEKKANSRS